VNDALFHLDDYRYSSLVNLLIQLRRPQLTRRLHEEELSGALSEALCPVSPAIIGEVAEAFRNLESDRNTLESFETAMNAVEQFLTGYRTYAQVAARRRADRVWMAHQEYEAQMKEMVAAEAECGLSLAELTKLKTEIERLSSEQHDVEAKIAVLQLVLGNPD
jgi:chromosome segregation ATPase